ncbi:MAG: carbohydrate ABC transporter substrate-binding protein [Clostridia bacterium]|nr:carbohydrate ABC transporter substrate-binding protein [Clostridia bacterium]
MKQFTLLVLLAALLAGCGDAPASAETTAVSGETDAPETTTADLLADLPTEDFGGYEFNILGLDDPTNYIYVQMTAEEMNGDLINDTVFTRNQHVEEDLNIKLNYIGAKINDIAKNARASVLSGNDEYDIVFNTAMYHGPVTAENIFLDISGIDSINFDKPWWNVSLANQLSVDGKMFMLHGDLNYHYLYNVWTIFFNQQIITDYKLESPFTLVKNGTWTVDKLVEYCRTVVKDVNADGNYVLTDDDICGLVSNNSSFFAFLYGAGGELVTKDGDIPVFKGATEKLTTIYEKLLAVTTDTRVYTTYGSMTNPERFGRFAQGQFLFSAMMVGSSEHLRDMEADFGLVPFPKLDEAQETYYSYAGPSMSTMAIPITATDPERTGVIIEHLSARSYGTLRTAYFNTTLQDKFMRDEASVEMLDYLYSDIKMDLGYVYGFGGVHNTFMNTLAAGDGIVSALASVESAVNEAINTYIENISK